MDTIEAIHSRRSVRAYAPEPVARETLEALIWDAAQAPPPTAAYVRPWQFHVVQTRDRMAALEGLAMDHVRANPPAGWNPAWLADPAFTIFRGAPNLILLTAPLGDANAAWDCCRAAQTLMLSAHARGLGTCWVGAAIPWLSTDEGRAALAIPQGHQPIATIVLGRPSGELPPAPVRERPPIVWC